MKNLIYSLAYITLLVSCNPENPLEKNTLDTQSNIRTSDDFVGAWEDTEGFSWVSDQNPDNQKPLYQLNIDGTYLIRYQHPIGFPTFGTWSFDSEQSTINFAPGNLAGLIAKYYWVVDTFNTETMNIISSIEPTAEIDGVLPEPTYKYLRLFKK